LIAQKAAERGVERNVDKPIPDAALSQHIAILGKTGSGKTYAAKGVVEGILSGGGRVCVIDPTGAWHGLRSSATGKSGGFPVVIFGGEHADLPLGGAHGEALAEIIGTASTPAIIDTSLMRVGERTRFFADFADALVRKNKGPLHLVIDEAHLFAPQGKVNDPQSGAMLHAANNLVSLGRSRGLRIILITQRPAKLHKDSLTQVETLVALRLIAPQDRSAVEEWIKDNADQVKGREIISSLATLKTGEGWVWAPEIGVLDRVRFPKIKTFDTSRAPEEGEDGKGPVLAPIDKDAIQGRLEAVAADAVANDPTRLKAEVAKLKRELAAKPAITPPAPDPEAEKRAFEAGVQKYQALIVSEFATLLDTWSRYQHAHTTLGAAIEEFEIVASAALEYRAPPVAPRRSLVTPAAKPRAVAVPLPKANGQFTGPQHRVLRSLAMWKVLGHPNPSREMVAAASGYSPGSGNFNNLLGGLAAAGAIGKPMPGHLSLLMDVDEMSADEGRQMLLDHLNNPQRKLVDALNGAGDMSRDDLGARTDYSPGSGNFNNLIGSLSTLGLITKPASGYVALADWAQELLA
jgi:hypothetical protein